MSGGPCVRPGPLQRGRARASAGFPRDTCGAKSTKVDHWSNPPNPPLPRPSQRPVPPRQLQRGRPGSQLQKNAKDKRGQGKTALREPQEGRTHIAVQKPWWSRVCGCHQLPVTNVGRHPQAGVPELSDLLLHLATCLHREPN